MQNRSQEEDKVKLRSERSCGNSRKNILWGGSERLSGSQYHAGNSAVEWKLSFQGQVLACHGLFCERWQCSMIKINLVPNYM